MSTYTPHTRACPRPPAPTNGATGHQGSPDPAIERLRAILNRLEGVSAMLEARCNPNGIKPPAQRVT